MRCACLVIPVVLAVLLSNCTGVRPGREGGDSGIAIRLDSPAEPFVLGRPMVLTVRVRNVSRRRVQVCRLDPEQARLEMHGADATGTARYVDGKLIARKGVISCYCESFTWVEVVRVAGKPREADGAPRTFVARAPPEPEDLFLDLAPGEERAFQFDLMKTDMAQIAIDAPGRFTVSLDYSYSIEVVPSSEDVGKPSRRSGGATSNTITVTVVPGGASRNPRRG